MVLKPMMQGPNPSPNQLWLCYNQDGKDLVRLNLLELGRLKPDVVERLAQNGHNNRENLAELLLEGIDTSVGDPKPVPELAGKSIVEVFHAHRLAMAQAIRTQTPNIKHIWQDAQPVEAAPLLTPQGWMGSTERSLFRYPVELVEMTFPFKPLPDGGASGVSLPE
jgi:hypothetical protein